MVIPSSAPRYALTRTVVVSFLLLFISFTLLFSYHPPFKTTLSKISPFNNSQAPHPPYTAAIIYLARLSHADELLESLASVNVYLPHRDPWPIILFHTGDFDDTPDQDDFLATLREKIGGASNRSDRDFSDRVEFVKLDWVLPEGIPHTKEELDPVSPSSWPGYHHMCAFYSTKIFFNPRLQDVTYYLRMDTDSLFLEPLCYDPFEVMHTRQRSYGYLGVGNDAPIVTKGLWRFLRDYADSHPEVELRLNASKTWKWPRGSANGDVDLDDVSVSGYYNNFEIVKLEEFRKPEVKEWLYHLIQYPEHQEKVISPIDHRFDL
ncbi:glycosyltransferase family 15 protein [Laccaria amethystina LaAM-08-1]|uniref:Glycosyltransferase family 15 protein n=1 Tax=Laccaria amethystina LaAM-08-1 TaxID=1095629 RepID=A0A0C9WIJ1_9AGAR|nr:glycosyltransferase family 15 protein [Laccaria amethystina LaAM-08-1]